MISTILSILGILTPIITWIMGKFGMSKQSQEAFINKVQSAKDDGLVSVQQRDEFERQDAELLKPIEEKKNEQG
jgi:hypothetical protein